MNIVVVGGGLAAASAVAELRAQGSPGDITLLAAEEHAPYERPPLSKGLLLGKAEVDSVFVHPQGWYDDNGVNLRTGCRATAIDLDRSHLEIGDEQLSYDRLLLATGATPRRLPLADQPGVPVAYLRTLDDSLALRDRLVGHLLVIGGGWIGLEVASAARQRGADVTLVEAAPLPLLRVLGTEVATVFADLHRDHGVDLRLGTSVSTLRAEAGRAAAHLDDGTNVTADLVLVAVGVAPTDELAVQAGLPVDNGILVDSRLRTADPHVYAAGDVANHDHPVLGARVRVEHWDAAIQHGRHAARVMLGDDEPYEGLPYFYTDQYDLGMEYVGHVGPEGYDAVVVRGDLAERQATVLWVGGGRVLAGMHLNDWDAIEPIRAVVGGPAHEGVRDPGVPLTELG